MVMDTRKQNIYNTDFPNALEAFFPLANRYEHDKTFFQKIIDKYGPRTILDAGCGGGFHIGILASLSPESKIVGIDNSQVMIQKAKERLRSVHDNNIELIYGDLRKMNTFIHNKFDLITCSFAIAASGNGSEILHILKQFKNLLTKNGVLIIEETNGDRLIKYNPGPEILPFVLDEYTLIKRHNIEVKVVNNRFFLHINHEAISTHKWIIKLGIPSLFYWLKNRNIYIKTYQIFGSNFITNYTILNSGILRRFELKTYRTTCWLLTKDLLTSYLIKVGFTNIKFFSNHDFTPYKTDTFSQIVVAR